MKTVRCLLLALLLAPSLRAEEKPDSFWDQKEAVLAAAFSPDSRFLATACDDDRSISIWDLETMLRKLHITDTGRMHHLLYTPDGKSLVVAGEGPISDKPVLMVIPLDGGKRRYFETSFASVAGLALSPNGRHMAALGYGGTVDLFDVTTGKPLRTHKGHEGVVSSVAFSPDGRTLATAGENDKLVKLWDVETAREKRTLKGHNWHVASLAFAPDGKTFVSGGNNPVDSELIFWELGTGTVVKKVIQPDQVIRAFAFSVDGKTLVSASAGVFQNVVGIVDWPSGKQRQRLEGPNDVKGVHCSSDGRWLLAFGRRHDQYQSIAGVKIWDAKTLRQRLPPAQEAERDRREKILREQEKRQELARVARDNPEREGYWKREAERRADRQRRAEYALAIQQADEALSGRRYSEARTLLDSLKPKSGELDLRSFEWHYLNGRTPQEVLLEKGEGRFAAIAVTADGSMVALADDDRQVSLIDGATGRIRTTLKGFASNVYRMAFSPDGRLLAVAGDAVGEKPAQLTLWNVATARKVAEFPEHQGQSIGLIFSPDSNYLAATGRAGMARVWDVRRQKLVHAFGKHRGETHGVAFSPDGKLLAVGASAGYFLYDLTTGKEKIRLDCQAEGLSPSVAFSADGRFAIVDGEKGRVLFDADDGKRVGDLKDPLTRNLVVDMQEQITSHTVRKKDDLFLIRFPSTPHRLAVETPRVLLGVSFSDDGRALIGEEDRADLLRPLGRWDVGMEWSRYEERRLVFDGKAGRVHAGDARFSLREIARIAGHVTEAERTETTLHAVSSDSRIILTSQEDTLALRDGATGKVRAVLPFILGRGVLGDRLDGCAAFSSDGRALFTYFLDATNNATDVITWDTATGKETGRIVSPGLVEAVRLDANGKTPVALIIRMPKDEGFRNWDVQTGEFTFDLAGNLLGMSPDGKLIATGVSETGVRLHDAVTGHLRCTLRDDGWPRHIAFSPDGKAMAVSIGNPTVPMSIVVYRVIE